MSKQEEPDVLWDAGDVASYFKASRSWVYHEVQADRLPHVRVRGLLRFVPDVVRAWGVSSLAEQ